MRRAKMVFPMYVATIAANIVLAIAATTAETLSPSTRRYTTCGPGDGPVQPVEIAPTVALAGKTREPLVGFFFTHEGHQVCHVAEGIRKFFQRYAECGLSK